MRHDIPAAARNLRYRAPTGGTNCLAYSWDKALLKESARQAYRKRKRASCVTATCPTKYHSRLGTCVKGYLPCHASIGEKKKKDAERGHDSSPESDEEQKVLVDQMGGWGRRKRARNSALPE